LNGFSRILLVDNTISDSNEIHRILTNLLPKNWEIIATDTNRYGRKNKGAGDIETYQTLSRTHNLNGFLFHHEARLLIKNPKLINTFTENPRNLICEERQNINSKILRKEKTISTGHFGIQSDLFFSFVNQVNLAEMVKNDLSIERLFWVFLRQNNIRVAKKAGYCLRHNPSTFKQEVY